NSSHVASTPTKTERPEKKDLSTLLNLVEEDAEIVEVKEKELSQTEVKGLDEADQLKAWGKSLENIISSSKKVTPQVAVNALEQVIDDTNNIEQNSKEYAFDKEEQYISSIVNPSLPEVETKKRVTVSPFIPTATKVYLQLTDGSLDKDLENYDG